MVRGPNVMLGYWKRPEETRQILAEDGWLHTGDQALIRDRQIIIKGRIKDIIVTSTGEKISPSDLERAILEDPFFEQVLVIGEQRSFISALAVVNAALLAQELARLGVSPSAPEAQKLAAVRDGALKRLQAAAAPFPSYATPRKVALTLEPWTVAAGLITPTLKPKRRAILEHFATEVEQLYAKG
jgi:long-chain acyl-CoA synthetase